MRSSSIAIDSFLRATARSPNRGVVVRERIILRKETATEVEHVVADLQHEHVEVDVREFER
jgi:hypothetical protein